MNINKHSQKQRRITAIDILFINVSEVGVKALTFSQNRNKITDELMLITTQRDSTTIYPDNMKNSFPNKYIDKNQKGTKKTEREIAFSVICDSFNSFKIDIFLSFSFRFYQTEA